jgi:hypothetical protein
MIGILCKVVFVQAQYYIDRRQTDTANSDVRCCKRNFIAATVRDASEPVPAHDSGRLVPDTLYANQEKQYAV